MKRIQTEKMKNLIIYTLCLFTIGVQAQSDVFEAIRSGDAEKVSNLMDRSVELCFDDRVDFVDRPQASKALAKFFKNNPPKSFNRVHKGNSPGADSKYLIGKYVSTNGSSYRVYIFSKNLGSGQVIQELRFDTE